MRSTFAQRFAVCLVGLTVACAAPASAAIRCNGIFQDSKYGPRASPYCSEEEIAKVAQSYGEKVTANEVHNNPLTKVNLCFRFGRDIRLKGACAGFGPDNYGGH